ncbi:MAG: hypothetical protein AB9846_08350 [Tenuifilaceae bacterium]
MKITHRCALLTTYDCFSGSVFKTRGLSGAFLVINGMDKKLIRIEITAGNDNEDPDELISSFLSS